MVDGAVLVRNGELLSDDIQETIREANLQLDLCWHVAMLGLLGSGPQSMNLKILIRGDIKTGIGCNVA